MAPICRSWLKPSTQRDDEKEPGIDSQSWSLGPAHNSLDDWGCHSASLAFASPFDPQVGKIIIPALPTSLGHCLQVLHPMTLSWSCQHLLWCPPDNSGTVPIAADKVQECWGSARRARPGILLSKGITHLYL